MTHTRGEGDERIHKLAWDALEYTGIAEKLAVLDKRFVVRAGTPVAA